MSAAERASVAPAPSPRRRWVPGVLPGFRPTLGVTLTYLSLIVLIPLAGLVLKTAELSWADFWRTVSGARALATYRISFGGACIAALVNAACGLIVAWVLARYRFPGKAIADSLVDLPLALPTSVAGIALTAIYSKGGWIGRLLEPHGIHVAFAPAGVVVAMVFVGLPFVVRTIQPVLLDLDPQAEEASCVLGATRLQTFRKVIFPALLPSLMTGFALAFARAVGEYGSIVFISGNMPLRTEIVPLLIITKLDQYDYPGATALAVVMLAGSFVLLMTINALQAWSRRGLHG
ncbi:MAG TPA: sulfate ABC transporter permease subunit CysT [Polyangiaceae bacterium]|nr:sulfate ABC transporter permease subunit CysT [Polyangiaceae bacterium]